MAKSDRQRQEECRRRKGIEPRGFSGILCNYCRLSPNATYLSKFGGLAACGRCVLSIAGIIPTMAGALIHWRKLSENPGQNN